MKNTLRCPNIRGSDFSGHFTTKRCLRGNYVNRLPDHMSWQLFVFLPRYTVAHIKKINIYVTKSSGFVVTSYSVTIAIY